MRSWIKIGKLVLAFAAALLVTSCDSSIQSRPQDGQKSSDADSIEDSGTRLSGEFVLNAVEDAYRPTNSEAQPQTVFRFDQDGSFKRQDKSRVEEGAYLIGSKGELVIYIEKVNGEQLSAARVERFLIVDRGDNSITLQRGPSKTLVLRKR